MIQLTSTRLPSIAIIGTGFSGSMVATHLLQNATVPLSIKLIEPRPETGRGVAYSTTVNTHLLNVPAGKMSAFADRPTHLLQWLEQHQSQIRGMESTNINASTFIPRSVYGDYIQSVLSEAMINAPSFIQVERITAEAMAIETTSQQVRIYLETGEWIQSDQVVLALGNFPSQLPKPLTILDPQDVRDGWSREALTQLDPDASVLLVGTGLTMVDMVVALHQQGHRGKIHAVSRHGLRPQRHQLVVPHEIPIALEHLPTTMRMLLRQVRQEIQAAMAQGQDWRAVIDALRPNSQQLWQRLSLQEQKRFLRHVKAYWEVHRHRIAPEIADLLDHLTQSGQLVYYAGRIQNCTPKHPVNSAIEVRIRQRSTQTDTVLSVQRVINCTGANCDYRRLNHPLIESLHKQHLIRFSALGVGIETADNGAIIDANGQASKQLYTLGPPRKGSLWETTAVPELRVQADHLAQVLLRSLPAPSTGFSPSTGSSQLTSFVYHEPVPAQQAAFLFRQLFDQATCTYTYLIADPHLNIAVLVDPVLEQLDRDLQVLNELGLTLYYCLETHIHADHITGAHQLRHRTGCQVIVPDHAPVLGADRTIRDGETLQIGRVQIKGIATPGHTSSHMAYLINHSHILTGDALFIRGCGRTDFQDGDAGHLYDAVTQKLFTLADDTLVYPGHDYQGRTVSTIKEEKRWNPRFQRNRTQFIELMENLKLPHPKRMNQAIAANERCGFMIRPPIDSGQPTDSRAPESQVAAIDPLLFVGMYI